MRKTLKIVVYIKFALSIESYQAKKPPCKKESYAAA